MKSLGVACVTSLEENAQEEPVFAPPEHVQERKRYSKQENFETAVQLAIALLGAPIPQIAPVRITTSPIRPDSLKREQLHWLPKRMAPPCQSPFLSNMFHE